MTQSTASLAPTERSTVAGRTVAGMLKTLRTIFTALKHRREVGRLAELDDRALQDIGLVRSRVDLALAEPYFVDPSAVLVRSVFGRPPADETSTRQKNRPVVPMLKRLHSD
jgi:uncharacterized protein YjiS (DUF1127 family)